MKSKKERTNQSGSPLLRKLSLECTKHPTDVASKIVTLNLNYSKNSKFTRCLFPSQTKALIGQLALTKARWSISWRNALMIFKIGIFCKAPTLFPVIGAIRTPPPSKLWKSMRPIR